MAVLGSNTLNHSDDLTIQRAGVNRITATSTGVTLDGATQIVKNAHTSGASAYHLELFSNEVNTANEVSLRMHQGNLWWGQIRLRSDGFHFTDGNNNNYKNIFAGTVTATTFSGNLTGTATNATNIIRQGTTSATNLFYRVLLGPPSNTAGASLTYVVTDASRLLYNPSTDTLTCGNFSGTATNCSRQIINGNGMNFTGGALNTNRTITLGTPSTCTGSTANAVTTSSHTHTVQVNLGVTGGTTAGPTITSSAGTNATIPSASTTASGVITTGNQNFSGQKGFTGTIVFSNILYSGSSSNSQSVTTQRFNVQNDRAFISIADSGGTGHPLALQRTGSNGDAIRFIRDTSTVGEISFTANVVTYGTGSDYRLKENLTPLTNSIERIKNIPVYKFNFISSPEVKVDGFLAHEVQDIIPEAVVGTKDQMTDIGILRNSNGDIIEEEIPQPPQLKDGETWEKTGEEPKYQSIDQSKLVPLLTSALQEAIVEIENLKERVIALENA